MAKKAKREEALVDLETALEKERAELAEHWWWFFGLGIALVILGTLALGSSFFVGLVSVLLIGVLMLMGGVAQIISAFTAPRWSGFVLQLFIGILYVVAGLLLIEEPAQGLAMLTLLLAAFFMVGGIFRIATALALRFRDWGWALLNGVTMLLLGILIRKGWPDSKEWVIGMFVGIEMIFNGWAWGMLGLGLRATDDEE